MCTWRGGAACHRVGNGAGRAAGSGQVRGQVGFLRGVLSVGAVRARARLVLGRLRLVGEGAKQAQQRRSFLEQQSSKFDKELQRERLRSRGGLGGLRTGLLSCG